MNIKTVQTPFGRENVKCVCGHNDFQYIVKDKTYICLKCEKIISKKHILC